MIVKTKILMHINSELMDDILHLTLEKVSV